ncbi:MAG: hypothetical protein COA86_07875 [Kangiella sp.]|nr:MAG: hypothetical protein COA86_07875 [Kangiella sp.]
MSPDQYFYLSNGIAALGWLLLFFAPKWKWTKLLCLSYLIPFVLALIYSYLLAKKIMVGGEGGFFPLEQVVLLLQNPASALIAWIHILTFDLFVGSMIVIDAQKQGISHWILLPCLIITLLYGPFGFVVYMTTRYFIKPKARGTSF